MTHEKVVEVAAIDTRARFRFRLLALVAPATRRVGRGSTAPTEIAGSMIGATTAVEREPAETPGDRPGESGLGQVGDRLLVGADRVFEPVAERCADDAHALDDQACARR